MRRKILDKEYWDAECVDDFETYWGKELTNEERATMSELKNRISNTDDKSEVPELYREAVNILHSAYCRAARKKFGKDVICSFREPMDAEWEKGIGFFGVSEVRRRE